MKKQQKIIIGICLIALILLPTAFVKFFDREVLSVGDSYLQIKTNAIYKTIDGGLKIELGIENKYNESIAIDTKNLFINGVTIELEESTYPLSMSSDKWEIYISKELLGDSITIDSIETIGMSFNVRSLLSTGNLNYDTKKIKINKERIESAETIKEEAPSEEESKEDGMTEEEYEEWLEKSRASFIESDLDKLEGEEFENLEVEKLGDNAFKITLGAAEGLTKDMILNQNASNLKEILKALQDGNDIKSEDYITICFDGDTVNSNGNSSTGTWIKVCFDGNVINEMNCDNLLNYQVLKKADDVWLINDLKEGLKSDGDYAFLKY